MAYHFIHVDKHAKTLSSDANMYRDLRLEALEESPTSFSSTWSIESCYSDDTWASRLRDPVKETFACIYGDDHQAPTWVAQVTLRGPLSATDFALPPESGQETPSDDAKEERWQMLSLYTSKEHRGKGLGSSLCQHAVQWLSEQPAGKFGTVIVRAIIKPDNEASIRMYQKLGFAQTGKATLEEAMKANGEADLIPKGILGPKYTTRMGVIMARQLEDSRREWC